MDSVAEVHGGVQPVLAALEGTPAQIAPSTYYAFKARPASPRSVRDEQLTAQIKHLREENMEVYGARKVWHELSRQDRQQDHGHRHGPVARCTVERLMRAAGLRGVLRDKHRAPPDRPPRPSGPPTWSTAASPRSGQELLVDSVGGPLRGRSPIVVRIFFNRRAPCQPCSRQSRSIVQRATSWPLPRRCSHIFLAPNLASSFCRALSAVISATSSVSRSSHFEGPVEGGRGDLDPVLGQHAADRLDREDTSPGRRTPEHASRLRPTVRRTYYLSMNSQIPAASDTLLSQIDAIRLAVVRLERKLRKHADADVTPSQLSALFVLQRHGPMRPGELAEREQISKSTATGLINRLEEKDFIRRTVDSADARSHLLDLTDGGRRLLQRAAQRSNDYLRERIRELDHASLARLLDAIDVLQHISGPSR